MVKTPTITFEQNTKESGHLILYGDFVVDSWEPLRDKMLQIKDDLPSEFKSLVVDFKNIEDLDTFGTWRLSKFFKLIEDKNIQVSFENIKPYHKDAILELKAFDVPSFLGEGLERPRTNPITAFGELCFRARDQFFLMISFMGLVIQSIGSCIVNPKLFRTKSFIKYIDITGVRALPIIGLVSLLIGIVLVYQGVSQLERFGAEIFTVNLLAVSVLRELGILLTAIVVAGRSGSSFTAQIGFMKLNQEIDAMKVLGISPLQILVVPRILALIIVMPLLTIYCDLVALAGGAFMSMRLIGLTFEQFLTQLQLSIEPSTFWVGIIKAPVFAFVIGLIGCYEGLRVRGGAENVGRHTTRSVVKSIFMVIVLNAFFSVLFSVLKV